RRRLSQRRLGRRDARSLPESGERRPKSWLPAPQLHDSEFRFPPALPAQRQRRQTPPRQRGRPRLRPHRPPRNHDPPPRRHTHRGRPMTEQPAWGWKEVVIAISLMIPAMLIGSLLTIWIAGFIL